MNNRFKVNVLLLISVVTVGMLSVIQYYLVNNTYQLIKEKYYTEVKREIGKITASRQLDALDDSSKEVLKRAAHQYIGEKLSKPAFFSRMLVMNQEPVAKGNKLLQELISKNPLLRGVHYKAQYDEIILEINGRLDTLLSGSQPPFIYLGSPFHTPNTLKLSTGNTYSTDNEHNKVNGRFRSYERFKLHFLQTQYVDVSVWKEEVFKRMYGILLLGTVLIIAVITVFYLVFRAMLRQKRLADIKTDFANNITHELKTPLSSVNIIFKSLNKPGVKQDTQLLEQMLEALERQYDKIKHTVDSVLDSAMAENIAVVLEKLEISGFLHNYLQNQTVDTHTLVITIQPQKATVTLNKGLMERALNNVLQNAIKYSEPGSIINFKAWADSGWYFISISDEGPGIAKEYRNVIFDKFYRLPEHNRHTVKGLGLGLYLSKQAVTRLSGSITLDSNTGKGSTFTIKLPIDES